MPGKTQNKHGGKRKGAGRPNGLFSETTLIRVPIIFKDQTTDYVAKLRRKYERENGQ